MAALQDPNIIVEPNIVIFNMFTFEKLFEEGQEVTKHTFTTHMVTDHLAKLIASNSFQIKL